MNQLDSVVNDSEKSYEKKGYLAEEFRLFHLKDTQKIKVEYHYHEFYKFVFLLSGNGVYYIEGKGYQLKAGDIILVNKYSAHRSEFEGSCGGVCLHSEAVKADFEFPLYSSCEAYERIILYISPEFLEENSSSACELSEIFAGKHGPVLRPEKEEGRIFEAYLKELESELSGKKFGKEVVSKSILLRILAEVERSFLYGSSKKPPLVVPENKQVREIVNYLNQHMTEAICIDDLAKRFYLSRFHMMRKFKEETGQTIYNYLSEQRLFLAKNMIVNGCPATEACFMCGFQSYASFARAYGKLFGVTPTGRRSMTVRENGIYE